MTVLVRAARPADAAAIAVVHVASWRAAYHGIVASSFLDALDVRARAAVWAERLTDPAQALHTLVAESGGDVVGLATAGPSRDDDAPAGTAEIQAIYVAPDSWGSGAGRALMTAAIDVLVTTEPRFTAVTLWVLRDNAPARRFYEAAGFAPDGATMTVTLGDADLLSIRLCRALTR